jgi:hypothetical protein
MAETNKQANYNRVNRNVYNTLKWLAVITMTIDHIGLYLYPDMMWFRWVGRISFPLFLWLSVTSIRRIRFYPKKRTRTLVLLAAVSALTYMLFWVRECTTAILLVTPHVRSRPWLQLVGLLFSPWVDYGWVGFLFGFYCSIGWIS